MFSRLVGTLNPYTGSINARIMELGAGHATAQIRERKQIRNHVNSIHAVALINLAEVTTGLPMMYALPRGTRGIPVGLSIEYLKKSRGVITCECSFDPPDGTEDQMTVDCTLRDEAGDIVATAAARWKIGRQ